VTQFGGSIDELEVDFFGGGSGDLGHQGLSEHEDSLLGSDNTSLDHDEVISDDTIVGETTQRCDVLFAQVSISGGVILDTGGGGSSDSVHLLVHLGSVVITQLTSSGDTDSYSSRVPSSDATHFSITSMGFLLEVLNAPTFNDALESFTLGDTDHVNHFILTEHRVNLDLFFEVVVGEVHLLGSGSTINLNFEHVVLFLTELGESLHLGRADGADDSAVLLDSVHAHVNRLSFVFVLLGVLGESFLLGVNPVLVETTKSIAIKFLSPDGGEGTQSSGSVDVSNHTNDSHGRSFDHGHSLDNFLSVELGPRSLDFTHNMGHTGFETSEGSEVARLLRVVLREGSYATSVMSGSALRGKTEVTVSGCFEFTV